MILQQRRSLLLSIESVRHRLSFSIDETLFQFRHLRWHVSRSGRAQFFAISESVCRLGLRV